jgi:hypothetical protein
MEQACHRRLAQGSCCAGVFQGPGANCLVDTAQISVKHVDAAVDAALHRTRTALFHSMR